MSSAHAPRASDRAGRFLLAQSAPERFYAFLPNPLPPSPPLQIDGPLRDLLDRAHYALGYLNGMATLTDEDGRHADRLTYSYVRKEAVLSSRIEGTQSSLSDLLIFEHGGAPGVPIDDVRETSNYVAALRHGLSRLDEGFPLSLRLIREVHRNLLASGRGSMSAPGEFRRTQNWIGGSRPSTAHFVPPPAQEVLPGMGHLEQYLHGDDPALIRAGLSHAQFETIHPFLDGNGRVGRLLITLMLCAEGLLAQPVLYLSLFFKRNRSVYYDLLDRVRTHGAWEEWLAFFVEGVAEVAEETAATTHRVAAMERSDRGAILSLGRPATTALGVYEIAMRGVVVTALEVAEALDVTRPTAASAIGKLEELGILREITGRRRDRVFAHDRYLALLSEGTD